MPVPSFEFKSQAIQIDYAMGDGGLRAVRDASARANDVINLNHIMSSESSLVLQSPTGSSQVKVTSTRATLNTKFFAEFVPPDAGELRREYTGIKFRKVLELLEAGGAALTYLGFSTVARGPVSGDRERFHAAAVHAAGLHPRLTEGHECFDFTLRASRVADDDTFANIHLNWFQERTIELPVTPEQMGAIQHAQVNVWEMTLAGEGLEFKYDRNNKRGLFAGRRAWSSDDFLRIVSSSVAEAPSALKSFTDAMREAMDA